MSNVHGSKWIRPEKRLAIYHRDGFACVYCARGAEDAGSKGLSLDHVTPREMGGTHDAANLVTCCVACNSARQDTSMRDWFAVLRDRGIDTTGMSATIRKATARKLDMVEGRRLLAARKVSR